MLVRIIFNSEYQTMQINKGLNKIEVYFSTICKSRGIKFKAGKPSLSVPRILGGPGS